MVYARYSRFASCAKRRPIAVIGAMSPLSPIAKTTISCGNGMILDVKERGAR